MLRRLGDRGEGSLSYIAIALLVGAIAAAVTVVAVPDSVTANIKAGVCEITRVAGCDPDGGGDDRANASPSATAATTAPASGASPTPSTSGGLSPEQQEYEAARAALAAADRELNGAQREWDGFSLLEEIGKLGLDFLAGDIVNCVKKPNVGDCLWALVGVVPWGKIGKLLKSIPKVIKLIDRFLDLKRRLDKARKARRDARTRLDKALEACKRQNKRTGNSFLPGTPVLMADGTRKPIERVRVGDMVWASDPVTGRSGPRRVAARIVGDGPKDLVDLTVDLDGSLGGPTARVTATANHPFWVTGVDDYIDADHLAFGDVLGTAGGGRATVVDSSHRRRHATVYNLTVEDLHTYFVGLGGTDVLVHNDPTPGPNDACSTGGTQPEDMKGLRPHEIDTMNRLRKLFPEEDFKPTNVGDADYIGKSGKFDAMGHPNASKYWSRQRNGFLAQIERHAQKSDYAVVDLTGFQNAHIQEVMNYIKTLSPELQRKIIVINDTQILN
ncbi:polymorphic toxin-type HINT domain-containing protein [Actinomadura keratinilytica]|jgi:hypothetical protein